MRVPLPTTRQLKLKTLANLKHSSEGMGRCSANQKTLPDL